MSLRLLDTSRLPGLLLLLVLVLSCSGPAEERGRASLPSNPHPVALLVLDGVRSDSIDEMPFLAEIAKQSIRFDWAFAQAPDTAASMASTLTGLYPTTHGLVLADERLTDDALTLAELLGEAGMRSAAFLEYSDAIDGRGLEQGFDTFESGPAALDKAKDWIAGNTGKDFFLLAGTDAVSAAVDQGDPAHARSRYDEALQAVDLQARSLVEALGDSATLIVLATRGSELGEHSTEDGPTLHATRSRVPLMIRLPGAAAAQRIDKIVELVDLPPTLLELTGTGIPLELQGSSMLSLVRGEGSPPYLAFGESPHRGGQQFAVLAGYRMILSTEGDSAEVYALASDPLEATDVGETATREAEVLRERLVLWEKMISANSLDPERRIEELDDATLEKLKELGYIQ